MKHKNFGNVKILFCKGNLLQKIQSYLKIALKSHWPGTYAKRFNMKYWVLLIREIVL